MSERQYNHTIWKQTWTPCEGVEVTLRIEAKAPLTAQELGHYARVLGSVEGFVEALEPEDKDTLFDE